MTETITVFVGLDLGDKYTEVCVLDGSGTVTLQTRVRTTAASLTKTLRAVGWGRVVMEVGTPSRWVSELALSLGHEVVVANARQVKLICGRGRKTDRSDAELLARLGRADPTLLAPVRHRARSAQVDLVHLRARDVLVKTRTLLINHVRGIVKSFGARVPKCDSRAFVRHATPVVPQEIASALEPVLTQVAEINSRIDAYDRWAELRCKTSYPETERLMQVQGVGPIVSLGFVLTIDDAARFRKSRDVGAYLGLSPIKRQSGDRDPELGITKAGDPFVRRLLVNSAQYILARGRDSDLRRWGLALAARGKKAAKKKAIVAVSRKLAVLLHRLWVTGETYRPIGHVPERLVAA